jgi:hypothetical protein
MDRISSCWYYNMECEDKLKAKCLLYNEQVLRGQDLKHLNTSTLRSHLSANHCILYNRMIEVD